MKIKEIGAFILMALLTTTVGCQNDEEEDYKPSPSNTSRIVITDEMRTGFEPMRLLGEWTLQKSQFKNAPQFTEPVKIYFYPDNKAYVDVPEDFDYFMESGVYSYTYKPKNSWCDSSYFELRKGNKVYTGNMTMNYLLLNKPADAGFFMKLVCEYSREQSPDNAIPHFFNHLASNPQMIAESRNEHILAINNMEEFKAAIKTETELPQIDFSRYTLVIGWIYYPTKELTFEKLEIQNDAGECKFKVRISSKDKTGCVIGGIDSYVLIWRLFPKFEGDNVSMEVEDARKQ